jgi:two-component system CheB/CheR fusion protein
MNTINRRIIRRMLLYKITQLKEYAKLLSQKKEEIDILYQDLLINVTSFFRDTDTHKYLKDHLFPKLLLGKKPGESLRIWVPACATGEEAYSIAMILLEIQESKTTNIPVQIFATDLSEQAIIRARIGTYTMQEMETVSPKRLHRFFNKSNDGFRVNKAVRDMCVFATHNILQDPPFSRLDFISCCNLFIYLDNAAQKKAINTFHYALNDGGFLMLGKSENITQSANLFKSAIEKYKIFLRKNSSTRSLPQLSQRFVQQTLTENNIPVTYKNQIKQTPIANRVVTHNGLDNAIDAVLITEFMPASVVINLQLEIIQFRGTTDLFLTHPKGKATFNILKMARPEIAFELRNGISKVIKTKQRIRKSGIELRINSEVKIISLEIVPLKIQSDEDLLLILFTEQEQTEMYVSHTSGGKTNSLAKDRRIKKLEEELALAYADAIALSQEHEAFTEELQSANEEVVSSNEELQTLNEELETSKEEIESANEELTTTNQELQTRNDLLNESYDYSVALLSTLHEPMIVLDKKLRVKSANKAFYEKFKVKEEETEGELLYDLGNKQWNIPLLKELLENILPRNTHFHDFEIVHNFPFIGEKIMLLNASRIIQKANHEELILLAVADVTEIRKLALANADAEKKILHEKIIAQHQLKVILEENQKQLQNIFLNAPAATAVLEGPEHTYILANSAYQKLFSRQEKDFLGKTIYEVFPELTGTGAFELVDRVFESGDSFDTLEYPLMFDTQNDGILRQNFYHFSMEPLKNDLGKIYAVIAMIYDITEQVESRKKIEESEHEIRNIKEQLDLSIQAGKIGVWNWDVKKDIIHWNEEQKEIYGISDSEAIISSAQFNAQIFPEDLKRIQNDQSAGNKLEHEYDFRIIRKNDGEVRWIKSRAKNTVDPQGTLQSICGVNIDVTEQKLYEEKLIEAKTSAENAAKSRKQFLSNMSHEIRTPLNSLIGFTNILSKTKLGNEQKEFVEAIKTSGKSLSMLINDILDLAKVDAGKMTFETQPFEIGKSIASILHTFEMKLKEKNLELIEEYDNKIPSILLGDSLRLNQILLNLIGNAVKFTHTGNIKLSVKLQKETAENVMLKFVISDTGIGIADNKLKSIFNIFEQAEQNSSTSYGGTGLGLAIAKQLVEGQGGNISVKSKLSAGSIFTFVLPFGKTKIKLEAETEILTPDVEIQNLRILVVEDVSLNQMLIKMILNDFGFEQDIVSNGKLAIEKMQTNTYDIILMDLQMPEMNGFEATAYIRNTLKSQIPIIALTADVTTVDVAKCQELGMNSYISKPIDEKLLYNKIIELVKKKE